MAKNPKDIQAIFEEAWEKGTSEERISYLDQDRREIVSQVAIENRSESISRQAQDSPTTAEPGH